MDSPMKMLALLAVLYLSGSISTINGKNCQFKEVPDDSALGGAIFTSSTKGHALKQCFASCNRYKNCIGVAQPTNTSDCMSLYRSKSFQVFFFKECDKSGFNCRITRHFTKPPLSAGMNYMTIAYFRHPIDQQTCASKCQNNKHCHYSIYYESNYKRKGAPVRKTGCSVKITLVSMVKRCKPVNGQKVCNMEGGKVDLGSVYKKTAVTVPLDLYKNTCKSVCQHNVECWAIVPWLDRKTMQVQCHMYYKITKMLRACTTPGDATTCHFKPTTKRIETLLPNHLMAEIQSEEDNKNNCQQKCAASCFAYKHNQKKCSIFKVLTLMKRKCETVNGKQKCKIYVLDKKSKERMRIEPDARVAGVTPKHCNTLCAMDNNCTGFAFDQPHKLCHLYGVPEHEHHDMVKVCDASGQCELKEVERQPISHRYHSLHEKLPPVALSLKLCSHVCQVDKKCVGLTMETKKLHGKVKCGFFKLDKRYQYFKKDNSSGVISFKKADAMKTAYGQGVTLIKNLKVKHRSTCDINCRKLANCTSYSLHYGEGKALYCDLFMVEKDDHPHKYYFKWDDVADHGNKSHDHPLQGISFILYEKPCRKGGAACALKERAVSSHYTNHYRLNKHGGHVSDRKDLTQKECVALCSKAKWCRAIIIRAHVHDQMWRKTHKPDKVVCSLFHFVNIFKRDCPPPAPAFAP